MFYIARNKQRLGPYSLAQLHEFARSGQLQQEDMVLPQGQQRWIQASSIAGLFTSKADSYCCPSCGLIFDKLPKQDGTCTVCKEKYGIRKGRILSEDQVQKFDAECEAEARSRFPATDPCTRCGETQWQFVSLSPNELSARWSCEYCGKKVLIRGDTSPVKDSRRIPKPVQREVWQRDKGQCTQCGSRKKLEFDHIIPVSKGGSNTVRNIQLLCEACNRRKLAKIG
jgi:DNA-directed RNA polymerase subunit RPC12/RpoP